MESNKITRIFNSFVVFPIFATSALLNGPTQILAPASAPVVVADAKELAAEKAKIEADQIKIAKEKLIALQAANINAYYSERGLPLAGYGIKMAQEAYNNDIDYRLIPAIAMRESTGGLHSCKKVKNSAFGYGGCTISFATVDDAIETVALNLGGNNPRTAKYYSNLPLRAVLDNYNGRVVKKYPEQVMKIMEDIGPMDIEADLAEKARAQVASEMSF